MSDPEIPGPDPAKVEASASTLLDRERAKIARRQERPAATGRDPECTGPNQVKVEALIEALRSFISAIQLPTRKKAPEQVTAFEHANRLQRAIGQTAEDERWEDGPGEITAAGLISSYWGVASDTLAGIMGRAGASLVGGEWILSTTDEALPAFAYPTEIRVLKDAARGLAQALGVMKDRGPWASLNPMHNPEPIRPPDLGHLETLCETTAHWLEISRLREGEEPDPLRHFAIRDAVGFMEAATRLMEHDVRWYSIPRFQVLYFTRIKIIEHLRKMMNRGHLVWDEDLPGIRCSPPEPTYDSAGKLQFTPGPLFLDPQESNVVERALLDLRGALEKFRLEADKAAPKDTLSEKPRPAGNDQIRTTESESHPLIPPEYRTRPMSKAMASKLIDGKTRGTGPQRSLSGSIKRGEFPAEPISRQSFIFDTRRFPNAVQAKIRPGN